MTALRAEGCGSALRAQIVKKGRGWRRRLCRRVASLSLRGRQPFGLRVMECLSGNAYEVSVTGFTFSVIWHEKHSAELSAFGRYTPYPAVPDFPRKRGQNKSLYAFLQRHGSMAKHP